MALPVIFVKTFSTPATGRTVMNATPENAIGDRPLPRRFYLFNMVITIPFSFQNTDTVQLSDDGGTTDYYLIDRLGNPVRGEQLSLYAGTRRCLTCRYDSVTKTVMVLGNLCPTDYYINQWLNPAPST